MRGKEVFYPVGWDDNGLPTERRVQNYYGVRCEPARGPAGTGARATGTGERPGGIRLPEAGGNPEEGGIDTRSLTKRSRVLTNSIRRAVKRSNTGR